MKRDWTFYLQATTMREGDAVTNDIVKIENLTELEARAIKDRYREDHGSVTFEVVNALAPKAKMEFVG